MTIPYADREEAGRRLADGLQQYQGREDVLVLALPRGGVPVGYEIARSLNADLDLMLVRKLGAPYQPELAMGAIATGGARVLNRDIVTSLGIDETTIEEVADRERKELKRRERAYRGERPVPELQGKCVILVDDGLATGATMRAAVTAVRAQSPARIVVAVPVAPPDAVDALRGEADEVICPETPEVFYAISQWYQSFPQTSDEEVQALLARAWERSEPEHGPV